MTSESPATTADATRRGFEFRRLEVKYRVDRVARTALERDLKVLMRPDSHADEDGTYRVRSLYFDTADYMAYHEKMAGVARRHKLRLRVYGDPRLASSVRMEVKSRYNTFIHKLAADIPREAYGALEQALKRRLLPPASLYSGVGGGREFFRIQRLYNMEPNVIVEYRRQAFERRELSRVRVNFDDELRATRHLDLLGPLRGARPLLARGNAIFEIKLDGSMPFWLHMLISKYDLQHQALSKYCLAVRSEARMSALDRSDFFASPALTGDHAAPQAWASGH